jgi:hypothetical protein
MKRKLVVLLALSLFAVAAPALAEEGQHGAAHQAMDEQCAKECAMLLRNCAQEVDTIQERIKKLQVAINERGANSYTQEELKVLNQKLKEANEALRVLQSPR